ncbi:MAG: archaeal proteasome endopeptidase complex subunit alpha [Candidatus Hodarchaeales archaeon]
MFSPKGLGYDRSLTIFSPDGRLYQVEYANEAVRRGATCIGIKGIDGLILISLKGAERHTKLIERKSLNKIFLIEDHIIMTGAGLFSDLQYLVAQSRIYAQNLRLIYGEPAGVEMIAKFVAQIKQAHTQLAGYRPFGISTIIAGVNHNEKSGLYYTEPSGSYWSYKAIVIGEGAQEITKLLEEQYVEESISTLLQMACNLLKNEFPELKQQDVDITTISTKDGMIKRLSSQKIQKLFKTNIGDK